MSGLSIDRSAAIGGARVLRPGLAVIVGVAVLGLAGATWAEPPPAGPAGESGFRIGSTKIFCIKAPCPWRGVTRLDRDGRPEGRPFWTGDRLPPIAAAPADRDRIAKAWRDGACLQVEGRLADETLMVRKISGPC